MNRDNLKFAFWAVLIAVNEINMLTQKTSGWSYIITNVLSNIVIGFSLYGMYRLAFKK